MSNPVRPHRRQLTRLPRPWDSPGKNTGVGCHFLLQCMKVKNESKVAQSCPTLSDPMDCSLLGSSISGVFQARVLEWGAIASPKCMPRSPQMGTDSEGICSLVFAYKVRNINRRCLSILDKATHSVNVSIFPHSPLSLYNELVEKSGQESRDRDCINSAT